METRRTPALFVSHGSPMLAIEDSPARRFLQALGPRLPRPATVVVVSAHHDADGAEITSAARPDTIHDFGGFPRELYEIVYRAPGEPALAARIAERLQSAGLSARLEPGRGFDHGAWIPLYLMYPAADIPVLQVSIDTARTPAQHLELGRALRPLREEGVLLLASGGATHDLRLYMIARGRAVPTPPWVAEFNDWVAAAIAARRFDDLLRYREAAPYPERNHPTPEHFLPLFVALGAAFDDEAGTRIHASYDLGLLSLDAYSFGFDSPAARAT